MTTREKTHALLDELPEAELDEVVRGQFDFARHYHLLLDDETEE